MKTTLRVGCLAIAFIAAGCGGANGAPTTVPPTSSTTNASPQGALEQSVEAALGANHRLAKLVLWTNSVPASASASTRGPALTALRSAAAGRRRRGIHVKVVFDGFLIKSVALDPSYTQATAIVVDPQRVQPFGTNGKPLGHAVRLSESSRFLLHRIGNSQRFVVWQVTAAR